MTPQNEQHFEGKVAQKGIVIRDDTVLLVRDPRMQYVVWELPGGRMNVGEEPRAALARELLEELGCEFLVHEVVHIEQFKQGSEQLNALLVAYRATMLHSDAPFQVDAGEIEEIRWVGRDELATLEIFPEHKRAIDVFYQQQSNM